MRERKRGVLQGYGGRVVVEIVHWMPALAAMTLYVAKEDLLFFSYAVAYTLWMQFRAFRGIV